MLAAAKRYAGCALAGRHEWSTPRRHVGCRARRAHHRLRPIGGLIGRGWRRSGVEVTGRHPLGPRRKTRPDAWKREARVRWIVPPRPHGETAALLGEASCRDEAQCLAESKWHSRLIDHDALLIAALLSEPSRSLLDPSSRELPPIIRLAGPMRCIRCIFGPQATTMFQRAKQLSSKNSPVSRGQPLRNMVISKPVLSDRSVTSFCIARTALRAWKL